MVRTRILLATLAASLGLITGCASTSERPWFWRLRGYNAPDACCESGETITSEGPILTDCNPPMLPPPRPMMMTPQPSAQNGPTPSPVPRLVPQPAQSQPKAYVPQ